MAGWIGAVGGVIVTVGIALCVGMYKLGTSIGTLTGALEAIRDRLTSSELRITAIEKGTLPKWQRSGLPDPPASEA